MAGNKRCLILNTLGGYLFMVQQSKKICMLTVVLILVTVTAAFGMRSAWRGQPVSEKRIGGIFSVSPDRSKLTFSIVAGDDYENSQLHLLQISPEKPRLIPLEGAYGTLGAAWIPESRSQELLILPSNNEIQSVEILQINTEHVRKVSSFDVPPDILLTAPTWNPSGEILVMRAFVFKKRKTYFALSFDRGKNIEITEQLYSWPQLWVSPRAFYSRNKNKNKILRIEIVGKKLSTHEVMTFSDEISFGGVIGDKIIYVLDGKIYSNDKVIYQLKNECVGIVVDGDYIWLRDGEPEKILILDSTGMVIHEKRVPTLDLRLFDFCAKTGDVYLVKDSKVLVRYNFKENSKLSVLFDIDKTN